MPGDYGEKRQSGTRTHPAFVPTARRAFIAWRLRRISDHFFRIAVQAVVAAIANSRRDRATTRRYSQPTKAISSRPPPRCPDCIRRRWTLQIGTALPEFHAIPATVGEGEDFNPSVPCLACRGHAWHPIARVNLDPVSGRSDVERTRRLRQSAGSARQTDPGLRATQPPCGWSASFRSYSCSIASTAE